MKKKKVPMRMCVGCREMKPKKELLRIVKSPDENILLDLKGKAPGRGAYICPQALCLEKTKKNHMLEKALEHKINDEVYQQLQEELEKREN